MSWGEVCPWGEVHLSLLLTGQHVTFGWVTPCITLERWGSVSQQAGWAGWQMGSDGFIPEALVLHVCGSAHGLGSCAITRLAADPVVPRTMCLQQLPPPACQL